MSKLRDAAQQALAYILATGEHDQLCDVLYLDDEGRHKPCSCLLQDVLDALRAALAEQKPVGEVRWAADVPGTVKEVRWADDVAPPVGTQLYTAPQPQPCNIAEDGVCEALECPRADDTALLRQALEALEFFRDTAICEADTAVATEAIAALRERLGEKEKA